MIVVIVVAILILSYFGFNLKAIAESDTSKSNFSYVWNFLTYVWEHFLVTPATFIWNTILVGIVWEQLLKPGIHLLQTFANR